MNDAHSLLIAARVDLPGAGGAASAGPGRIQLLPMGGFAARDGRPATRNGKLKAWTLTPDIAAAVVARWRERKTPLVVDYEHQTLSTEKNGRPAPAAGWISSLEAMPAGLFAEVAWTERARAYIKADEYRYISPVFSFDPETGAVLELKSAALTNYPALDGMDAVAARTEEDGMDKELAVLLRQCLGLPAGSGDDAVLAELKKLPAGIPLTALTAERDKEIAALGAARAAGPDPSKYVPAALLTAERDKAAALAARVAELEKDKGVAALETEIDAALADGRLPKSCEAWARSMAGTSPEAIRGYIASAAPVAALKAMQTGGRLPEEPGAAALTGEELIACKAAGISEADFAAAKTAQNREAR